MEHSTFSGTDFIEQVGHFVQGNFVFLQITAAIQGEATPHFGNFRHFRGTGFHLDILEQRSCFFEEIGIEITVAGASRACPFDDAVLPQQPIADLPMVVF